MNRILEEAQVAEDTTPEGLEQIIAALMVPPAITFTDDDFLKSAAGRHADPLNVTVTIKGFTIPHLF